LLQTRPDAQLTVVRQATHVPEGPQCGVGDVHWASDEHGWPPPSGPPELDEEDEPPPLLDPDADEPPLLVDPDADAPPPLLDPPEEPPPLPPGASSGSTVASTSAPEASYSIAPPLAEPLLVEPDWVVPSPPSLDAGGAPLPPLEPHAERTWSETPTPKAMVIDRRGMRDPSSVNEREGSSKSWS
jgi:hypothetical protein